jgi:hypothetical protein
MYIGLHVIYSLFLSDFNKTLNFLTHFQKILSNLMKIRPVGAELFLADGRHVEVNSRFSQICESAIKI